MFERKAIIKLKSIVLPMKAMMASCAGLVVPRTTPKEIRTVAEIYDFIIIQFRWFKAIFLIPIPI